MKATIVRNNLDNCSNNTTRLMDQKELTENESARCPGACWLYFLFQKEHRDNEGV